MDAQNTRILSPVIQNDSTQTPAANAVKIKDKLERILRQKLLEVKKKPQMRVDKKRKITEIESPGQRTRQSVKKQVEKKEKEQVNKRKRNEKAKKEEQVKKKMVKEKKRKIEVSLPSGSKIKITPKNLEVLGIPMGKKKVESNSLRDFNDEFLIAFKKQFEDKKYPTTTDLSRLIQRTINIDFMFQINYLTLFANCMINCDNTSRLKYHVIKNIKSSDILNDFDWCSFIWDHIKTSKIGWDDRKLQNCKDATDREIFEMCQGRFGLVEVIEENEETENESEVKKRKLKEFKLFVKKFIEEFTTCLNRDEKKAGTSGARHGNDNDDVDYDGHCNDEDDVGHMNHGDVHVNGNDE
nr:hypothetical protein [Tanacetum cinerariifolium]